MQAFGKVPFDIPRTIKDYNSIPIRPETGNKARAASDRKMITQALVDLGYLEIRTCNVAPKLSKNKRAIKRWKKKFGFSVSATSGRIFSHLKEAIYSTN